MKKLFSILALLLAALATQASDYYGFKIGGVSVNSDNCNNVTGSNITSGTVKYDLATNTVTLTNVTIDRSGSDNRAIYNESNNGLTVKLVGTNYLRATDAAPVRVQKPTTIVVSSGTTSIIGGSEGGIYISGAYKLAIHGPGQLYVQANKKGGIEGSSHANVLEFSNVNASIYGGGGCLIDIYAVTFKPNSYVHLYGAVQNVKNVELMHFEGKEVIQSPTTAAFNPSAKTVAYYDFNTNTFGNIVNTGVTINDTGVVALINNTNFPDATFREFIKQKFSKFFIHESDVSATKTLNVPSNNISSVQGVEYFTALQTLKCSGNNIQSLDVTNFPALTTLNCNNNQLTSLDVSQNYNLKELHCSSNQLTTLSLNHNTKLESLECHSNNINGTGAANFVQALPNRANTLSFPFWMPGTSNNDKNELTWDQVQAIRAKGWYPQEYNAAVSIMDWQDYDGVVHINSTNFPDDAFRSAIYSNDINKDGKLTTTERKNVTQLQVYNSGINSLQGIEFFTKLQALYCQNNNLTSINLSNNTELIQVDCYGNQITGAGVEQMIGNMPTVNNAVLRFAFNSSTETNDQLTLRQVGMLKEKGWLPRYRVNGEWYDYIDYVPINSTTFPDENFRNIILGRSIGQDAKLYWSEIKDITRFDFITNKGIADLTGIEYFTEITLLYCHYNKLTELDVTHNTKLTYIDCCANQLGFAAIDRFIASLPQLDSLSGVVSFLIYDTYERNARPTRAQVQAAAAKGWVFKEYINGVEQELTTYPDGDINGDNTVDVSDVNITINIMLGKVQASSYPGNPDLNGDGRVDVSDVNKVINIMLGK